jgi:DNA-binding NarL/FixJ family response regulator
MAWVDAPGAPAAPSPFVGRRAELETIQRMLGEVEAGSSRRVVVVVGEPGIGKTRLLEELGLLASAGDSLFLAGRAAEFEREAPFAPFVDALGGRLADPERSPLEGLSAEQRSELGSVFPTLARGDEPARGTGVERFRLHRAVRALVGGLAVRRPLVLVLDDLQWADEASIELIAHLLRRAPEGRVLLALAYRPGQAPRSLASTVAQAERDGVAERIELGPLSTDEADELLGAGLDAALRRSLAGEGGGNPFYLEQLARAARAAAGSTTDGGRSSGRIPGPVMAVIEDEVATLSEEARDLLRAASVVGDPFELDLAVAVAGLGESETVAGADELVARDLARATEVPGRFAFRHPIVRAAVHESAGAGWRCAAHDRAARALAERGASATARAHHVEQVGVRGDEEAIALLTDAGAQTAARAPATAAHWYRAALRLVPSSADPSRRLGVLVPLAVALFSTGRMGESRDALGEALALIPAELARERAEVLFHIAATDHLLGHRARARDLLEGELARGTDPHAVVLLRVQLSVDHWMGREWDQMRDSAMVAREAARAAPDRGLEAMALAMLGLAEHFAGDLADASGHVEKAEELLAGLPDSELAARISTFSWLGYANYGLERFERAIAQQERGLAIARATGRDYLLTTLVAGIGASEIRLGRVAEAAEHADVALEAATLLGDRVMLTLALILQAEVALAQGRLELAEQAARHGVELARRTPDAFFAPLQHAFYGLVRTKVGDPAGAIDESIEHVGGEELLRLAPSYRIPFYLELTLGAIELGRLDAAERWVEHAERLARELGTAGRAGLAGYARAALTLAHGDAAHAAELAAGAARRLRSSPQPIHAARAETFAGRAFAAAGERAPAVEALERAHGELERCGAVRYRDQVDRELRRLGHRIASGGHPKADGSGDARATGITALSRRERQVAELAAAGLSNPQIAERLYLSVKTVESHMSRAFRKLGVSSRGAVARALEPPAGNG